MRCDVPFRPRRTARQRCRGPRRRSPGRAGQTAGSCSAGPYGSASQCHLHQIPLPGVSRRIRIRTARTGLESRADRRTVSVGFSPASAREWCSRRGCQPALCSPSGCVSATARRYAGEGLTSMNLLQDAAPAALPKQDSHLSTSAPSRTHAEGRPDKAVDARARILLTRLSELPDGHPDRARIRERVIELYIPLAAYLARRFRNRGEPYDDLTQVAVIGLIKTVDGYVPERGVEFASYAIPTIVGELKRHFR